MHFIDFLLLNVKNSGQSVIKFAVYSEPKLGVIKFLVDGNKMPGATWFPEARLSYAENMLTLPDGISATSEAIVFKSENGFESRLTFQQINEKVSVLSSGTICSGGQIW